MNSNTTVTRATTYDVQFCETTLAGPRMWVETFPTMELARQTLHLRSDTLMVHVFGVHKGYTQDITDKV